MWKSANHVRDCGCWKYKDVQCFFKKTQWVGVHITEHQILHLSYDRSSYVRKTRSLIFDDLVLWTKVLITWLFTDSSVEKNIIIQIVQAPRNFHNKSRQCEICYSNPVSEWEWTKYVHSPKIIWDWFYFDQDRSAIYEAMHAIHVTNLHL